MTKNDVISLTKCLSGFNKETLDCNAKLYGLNTMQMDIKKCTEYYLDKNSNKLPTKLKSIKPMIDLTIGRKK